MAGTCHPSGGGQLPRCGGQATGGGGGGRSGPSRGSHVRGNTLPNGEPHPRRVSKYAIIMAALVTRSKAQRSCLATPRSHEHFNAKCGGMPCAMFINIVLDEAWHHGTDRAGKPGGKGKLSGSCPVASGCQLHRLHTTLHCDSNVQCACMCSQLRRGCLCIVNTCARNLHVLIAATMKLTSCDKWLAILVQTLWRPNQQLLVSAETLSSPNHNDHIQN